MSFAQACEIADLLDCTLDELAGREWPLPEFADPRQEQMNADFAALPDEMRDAAAGAVHGMRLSASGPTAAPRGKNDSADGDGHPLPAASVA